MSPLHGQPVAFKSYTLYENLPDWLDLVIGEVDPGTALTIDGSINPFYIESDFNGDGTPDVALQVKRSTDEKSGILIIHGNDLSTYLFGAGNEFGYGSDDFRWMEVWKLYRKDTVEVVNYNEDFEVESIQHFKLNAPALQIAPSEGAFNLIAWQEDQYVWIHTGQ